MHTNDRCFLWLLLALAVGALAACAAAPVDPPLTASEALKQDQLEALESSEWFRRQNAQQRQNARQLPERAASRAADKAVKAEWLLEPVADPVTGTERCALTSTPREVSNGALTTSARIVITDDNVYLRTDATLDISPGDSGFHVDDHAVLRFEEQLNDVTAVVHDQREKLLKTLKTASFVSIRFAYQPQLGDHDTHHIDYSLEGFANQLDALSGCSRPAS